MLKPGEADRVVAGHPWIYHGSVLRMTAQAGDGELVQVKDHRQRLLGVGFYNSKSKINVRVLAPERIDDLACRRLRIVVDDDERVSEPPLRVLRGQAGQQLAQQRKPLVGADAHGNGGGGGSGNGSGNGGGSSRARDDGKRGSVN